MRIICYWHFDLDDAELVREARSSIQRQLPATTSTVLTLGGVASLRLQLETSAEEAGLALKTLDSVREKRPFDLSLAESTLFVGSDQKTRSLFESLCADRLRLETGAGPLSFCVRTSREGRLFLLASDDVADEFLAEILPRLDLSVARLETQVALSGEEVSRVSRERRGSDETIGRILHENVVAAKEDPARVARMHKEIEQLTSGYGRLATDSVMLQEALDRLSDLQRVAERAAEELGGAPQPLIEYARTMVQDAQRNLEGEQRFLAASLDKAKTAIDVVRTHVELDRSEQSLRLAERTLALQVAAGFVEFVLVFYYVEHSWEPLVGARAFEQIPAWIRFGLVGAFSGVVVAATHELADAIRERRRAKVITFALLVATLLLLVAAMFAVSVRS